MKYKIEKNIPMTKKDGFGEQYPWDKMKIGDSIYIEKPPQVLYTSFQSSICTIARTWGLYHGNDTKFSSRRENKGIRIWRVK